ncbi:MAG: hypothetical protein ABSC53_04160 [Bacteroidota bacterium]|jgi:hypothetical protein
MKHIFTFILSFILLSCSQKQDSSNSKKIQQPSADTIYGYLIDINRSDSGYVHNILTSMYTGFTISDGELIDYDADELFFGYNKTIIRINNLYVIPIRVGVTKLFLRNPNNLNLISDSVTVSVFEKNGILELQAQRTPANQAPGLME